MVVCLCACAFQPFFFLEINIMATCDLMMRSEYHFVMPHTYLWMYVTDGWMEYLPKHA